MAGKYIACGENDRAEYGKGLLKYLSERLTAEFGRGFTVRNLRNMRQFYLTYPKWHGYEEKVYQLANQMIKIDIDLDDEVKYNYEIFNGVLTKLK